MTRTPRTDARLLGALRRTIGGALAIVMVALGIATAVAAEPAEPSDVVVALDYSGSILNDRPNRTRFAGALEEIADRVEGRLGCGAAGDEKEREKADHALTPNLDSI